MTELWELVAREQIRHTIAAYTVAGDSGRFEEIAAQFTEDGVLDVRGQARAEGRAAIAALPEELRIPLILAEYEERSHAEIGEILGCTAKAVETRIYRARQQLRARLNKFFA